MRTPKMQKAGFPTSCTVTRVCQALGTTRVLHLAVLALLLSACASQRETALRHTLTAVNAASAGFVAWDEAHQQGLVRDASTQAEAVAALNTYRARRAGVLDGFRTAYALIATAALDSTASLADVLQAARHLYTSIRQLKGDR